MKIDVNELIIPSKGLGGLVLGMPENVLTNVLECYTTDNNFYGETKYIYAAGAIVAAISWRTKKVFRISALNGYVGKLDNFYYVGLPIYELLKKNAGWKYSEVYAVFENSIYQGIGVSVDLEDASESEALDSDRKIGEISVFNESFF